MLKHSAADLQAAAPAADLSKLKEWRNGGSERREHRLRGRRFCSLWQAKVWQLVAVCGGAAGNAMERHGLPWSPRKPQRAPQIAREPEGAPGSPREPQGVSGSPKYPREPNPWSTREPQGAPGSEGGGDPEGLAACGGLWRPAAGSGGPGSLTGCGGLWRRIGFP